MNDPLTTLPARRPASHKWALVVYVLVAGTNIWLNTIGYYDLLGIVVTVAGIAAFFAALFAPRASYTYTIGIIALSLVVLRSAESLWYNVVNFQAGLTRAPVPIALASIGFVGIAVCLLFFLLRRYTFGAASRQYYGLPATARKRGA